MSDKGLRGGNAKGGTTASMPLCEPTSCIHRCPKYLAVWKQRNSTLVYWLSMKIKSTKPYDDYNSAPPQKRWHHWHRYKANWNINTKERLENIDRIWYWLKIQNRQQIRRKSVSQQVAAGGGKDRSIRSLNLDRRKPRTPSLQYKKTIWYG